MTDLVPIPDQPALEWIGYHNTIEFHPPINLSRSEGLKFAASIADILDPEEMELEDAEWPAIEADADLAVKDRAAIG